jgi:hypothetical protein
MDVMPATTFTCSGATVYKVIFCPGTETEIKLTCCHTKHAFSSFIHQKEKYRADD